MKNKLLLRSYNINIYLRTEVTFCSKYNLSYGHFYSVMAS